MPKNMMVAAVVCLGIVWVSPDARAEREEWEFSGVQNIELDGTSGDIIIRPAEGETGRVVLLSDVHPRRNFRPEVEQRGEDLVIDEEWSGHSSRGHVEWTIYLPRTADAPRIEISTASGDLDCEETAARFDFNTASGDVTLRAVELVGRSKFDTASGDYELTDMTLAKGSKFDTASGDFDLRDLVIERNCRFSTASGDIECRSCKGYMEFNTASGDVEIQDSEISGQGEFSTASGNVRIEINELPADGLLASSASGDVFLDVGDFGDDFTLVMIKREDRGRISCPFDYTSEDTYERHDQVYEVKVVERGSGSPEVELRTASGKVVVDG